MAGMELKDPLQMKCQDADSSAPPPTQRGQGVPSLLRWVLSLTSMLKETMVGVPKCSELWVMALSLLLP